MDVELFERSPIGRLEKISGDHRGEPFSHFAYVPDPLPALLPLSPETVQTLTDTAAALGRLDGAGSRLPNPHLLVRPAIRREAVSTSALEGTFTTLPQILQGELFEGDESPSRDVDEVLSFVRASELGFARVKHGPMGLNLIKEMHRILLQNDPDYSDADKGEFRQRQNFIGPRDGRVEDSQFVPPPAQDVKPGLYAWEDWIHQPKVHLLIRVALGHYQFETIHPFVDGNGRLGRLIAVLMLLEDGELLSVPLLTISPRLEARRDEYQERLRQVTISGDFDPWVRFFTDNLRASAVDALDKTERLMALRVEFVETLRAMKMRGLSIQIAEDLIGDPILSTTQVAKRYSVTYPAALYALNRMVEAGVLEPLTVRGHKAYFSPRVLEIL